MTLEQERKLMTLETLDVLKDELFLLSLWEGETPSQWEAIKKKVELS